MNPELTNPNANFFQAGQGGNPNPVIDASSISFEQPQLNLPQAPQDTTDFKSIIGSVPTFENILTGMTAEAPAEKTATSLMDRILGTTKSLGTKKARQLEEENKAGLPQFQTQLTDVSNQLQSLQKEAIAIPLQLQQESTGRGITTGGLAPIQTGQLRQNAIKSLTLSAIGQTLQGNIANAQAQADRAIELEFAPQEQELAVLKQAYEFNKDILERQDKKRADALNFQIQERERAIKDQKEDRKIRDGFVAEAITTARNNGVEIPTLILQRAAQASNPLDALNVLSPYMVDTEAKANALLDRKIKLAQIDKIYADTALTNEQKNKLVAETQAVKDSSTPQGIKDQVSFLNDTLATAKELASAAGPSGISRFVGDRFVGNTKFRQLETFLDTLKTNVLTLAADPNVKKFFGPQMTENDVKMMVSIGTTLNAQNNTPEQLTKELERLETLFTKLSGAAESSDGSIPKGTDGASYGYPGYESDGTQWVLKK